MDINKPVALPERKDEIAKLGPLYSRPMQGEPKLRDGELIVMANKAAPHPTRDNDMFYIAMGRLVEEHYTHADPGEVKERIRKETESYAAEVERLRAQLAELTREDEKREALALSALKLTKEKASLASQNEFLNGQLAEAHALLRQAVDNEESFNYDHTLLTRIKGLLSASAEPNQCDGCQAGIPLINGAHRMGKPGGYADTMSCQAGKYAIAELSAPIEQDDPCKWTDRQVLDFLGVALRNVDLKGEVRLSEIRQGFEYMRDRAALERKPKPVE